MARELHYTSARAGLRPGTHGFCTVAASRGLPRPLVEKLEALSGYRPCRADDGVECHPVAWSYWRVAAGGRTYAVLSRVAAAGVDYSGRPNKYAHHLILSDAECIDAGPAWLMTQPGVFDTAWTGDPRLLDIPRPLPRSDMPPAPASGAAWAAATGDAGWAGAVADALADARSVTILCAPTQSILPLFAEALAGLPPAARWATPFCSYQTDAPPDGLACMLRACVAGSSRAIHERPHDRACLLDLTRPLPPAPDSPRAHAARAGEPWPLTEPTSRLQPRPPPPPPPKTQAVLTVEIAPSAAFNKPKAAGQPPFSAETGEARRLRIRRNRMRLAAALALILATLAGAAWALVGLRPDANPVPSEAPTNWPGAPKTPK